MIDHESKLRRTLYAAIEAEGVGPMWAVVDGVIQDVFGELVAHLAATRAQRLQVRRLQLAARYFDNPRRGRRRKADEDAS